jgi:prolyl-tRNA synthetase
VLVARAGEGVIEAAGTLVEELAALGVRVELDDRVDVSLGRRIIDHELRGVPLRVELGPRDLAAGQAVLARRAHDSKETVPIADVAAQVPALLSADQAALLDQAMRLRDALTQPAGSVEEALQLAAGGFARIPWSACGEAGEDRLAQRGISVRCLLREDGEPVDDPAAAGVEALVARAY